MHASQILNKELSILCQGIHARRRQALVDSVDGLLRDKRGR